MTYNALRRKQLDQRQKLNNSRRALVPAARSIQDTNNDGKLAEIVYDIKPEHLAHENIPGLAGLRNVSKALQRKLNNTRSKLNKDSKNIVTPSNLTLTPIEKRNIKRSAKLIVNHQAGFLNFNIRGNPLNKNN
tara:strand:- start:3774 stop:4172 length:399 start_codon:yes stop_codon:yes gene_type:complete